MDVTDMELRAKVEHLYVCLELYGRVGYIWMRVMLPPTILTISLCVVLCMYVSVRPTGLPFYLYASFPYVGFNCLFFLFWMSYDIVLITRDSEYIRGQLLSHESPYLVHMTTHERNLVMKRARAFRVPEFPVGEFTDFTLSLAIVVWEEVITQVLFLLSF